MPLSNSYGNDRRGLRRFLRSVNIPPNASNMERIGKEVRRTQSETERIQRASKEQGGGTYDARGRDMHEVVRRKVRRNLDGRPGPG